MGWVAGVLDDPPGFLYTPPGVDIVVNLVLLKCRKLRREDQETSDWIVSRILY